jgi:transposase
MKENTTKSMTNKELASLYNVSTSTFKRWVKPFDDKIGKKTGWFFKPKQVKKIFELLGEPY